MITDISNASRISNAVIVILLASSFLYGCSTAHSLNKTSVVAPATTVSSATCDANQTITTLEINGEQKFKIVSNGPINLVLGNNDVAQPITPETPKPANQNLQNLAPTSVPFLSSSSKLTGENKQRIRELLPQAHQAKIILVRGRSDASGSKVMNRKLAIARAINVKNELIILGVSPNKIKAMYCTRCYLATNDTKEGRDLNRQVDIQFYRLD